MAEIAEYRAALAQSEIKCTLTFLNDPLHKTFLVGETTPYCQNLDSLPWASDPQLH